MSKKHPRCIACGIESGWPTSGPDSSPACQCPSTLKALVREAKILHAVLVLRGEENISPSFHKAVCRFLESRRI